jgi:hypothetical protein
VPQAKTRVPKTAGSDAFLNIPYDDDFGDLFLSYISGLAAFGLTPRATLEIPGGARRLDRILELIESCVYSFHDLSRVELDAINPPTPRFNMPFELGLTVTWERLHPGQHLWFVLETKNRRALKSLSDLAGTDVYIHDGKPRGVFRELGNALVRRQSQPAIDDMHFIYRKLRQSLPDLMKRTGAQSLFEARVFKELVVGAARLAAIRLP